jgi:hypothetical protein
VLLASLTLTARRSLREKIFMLHLFGGGGCVAESYDSPFRRNDAAVGEGSRLGQVAVVSLHLFSSQHRRWEKRYSLRSGASMNLTAGPLRSAQVSICMEQRASASLRCGTSSCARLSKIEFGSGPLAQKLTSPTLVTRSCSRSALAVSRH